VDIEVLRVSDNYLDEVWDKFGCAWARELFCASVARDVNDLHK